MWKSVVWAPAATSLVSSATVWLLSRWVHLAVRRRALPSLATEAWMVSPLAKLVSGVATRLSASIALPRVTVVGATAGASTGAGAVVTGSAGALGGVAGTGSSRPQPTRATAPTAAASRAWDRRVPFLAVSSCWGGRVEIRRRRAVGPCLRRRRRSRAA